MLDRHLALLDVCGGRRARLAQPRLGQVEKRLVVALERFVAEGAKRIPHGASISRPCNEPADEDANREDDKTTDERGDQSNTVPVEAGGNNSSTYCCGVIRPVCNLYSMTKNQAAIIALNPRHARPLPCRPQMCVSAGRALLELVTLAACRDRRCA